MVDRAAAGNQGGVGISWTLGVITIAAGLYGLYALRGEWRGDTEIEVHRPPEWWPFDPPGWRALVRAGPMGAAEAPLMGVAIIASGLEDTTATEVLEVAFTAAAIAALGVAVIVALFNRPAALVPPRLRGFPGALDEWRGATVPAPREPRPGRD